MDVETQRAKAEALRELHKGPEILILPNAWDVGSARVSIGSSLARAAYGLMKRAAEELLGPGTFDFTKDAVPFADINRMFDR